MVLRVLDLGRPKRIIVIAGAVACVALIAGLAHSVGKPGPRIVDAAVLTSGSGFSLSGTVGDLTPGIASRLVLTVTNRTGRAITVRSVTIRIRAVPAGCPAANLTIDGADFTGSPPAVTIARLNAMVRARSRAKLPMRMRLARSAANGCQRARFPLRYSGTATTERRLGADRSTRRTSLPNPFAAGRPVTLAATVTEASAERSGPAGYVTFYRCTDPIRLPTGSPASPKGASA
jgi:hypothetical protein